MKRQVFLGLVLITFLFGISCRPTVSSDLPAPIIFSKTKSVSKEVEKGYNVEILIPWGELETSVKENSQIGFDIFLTDDDNGGLVDHKLSWFAKKYQGLTPIPAHFGTLTLKKQANGNEFGDIGYTDNPMIIDGNKEELWKEITPSPIQNILKGDSLEPRDFSGNFRALWDSNALYVFLEITDDTFSVDSWELGWEDDGVGIYLDPMLSQSTELVSGETYSYRILRKSMASLADDFPILPNWTLPILEVYDGGPGKDGIPSLLNPIFIPAANASYLRDDDLIIGYSSGDETRAYPHKILDWHEIINDGINNENIAISYCPLTGTGMGWKRLIEGQTTTFGVSGLLYNTNLILYDRLTDSNWSQMRLDCVEGSQQGIKAQTVPIIETTWKTWKTMFPNTEVLSLNTGYNRDYATYPYGDYRTNHEYLIFPINNEDDRLSRKTRVHGVIVNKEARIYPFTKFLGTGTVLIHDVFQEKPIIIAGSMGRNFIVSFGRKLPDGTILSFTRVTSTNPSVIMKDQEGNEWDILGRAVSGPRFGTQLPQIYSYMGYWFAFGAFFPNVSIK